MGVWVPEVEGVGETVCVCLCLQVPEVGVRAGFSEVGSQMVEVSLAEHAVLEETQLPKEHLRHIGQ